MAYAKKEKDKGNKNSVPLGGKNPYESVFAKKITLP
jgi:hypothetical protein